MVIKKSTSCLFVFFKECSENKKELLKLNIYRITKNSSKPMEDTRLFVQPKSQPNKRNGKGDIK